MPDDFHEKVVLVTGAGSDIGREAARAFAARGALVYGVGLHDGNLAETQDLIAQAGGTAHVARVDVSEEREVAAFLARISEEAGRLDVAFNNAGITGGAHRIEDYPTIDFDNVLRVNLRGVFLGMKYELPLMKRGGGGAICNTAVNLARSAIPAKRGGEASQVAAAAVWLCSAEASDIFGQMLVVDGGMTIGGFEFS